MKKEQKAEVLKQSGKPKITGEWVTQHQEWEKRAILSAMFLQTSNWEGMGEMKESQDEY